MFGFLLLFQFTNSDQPGPDNSTISPLDQCVFIFPAPLPLNANSPPATRIGYRKTKLLYLCSLGKTAKEKLICSCTMVLLILSSSPLSFSYSFFSLLYLFLLGWKAQSKCTEKGKRWRHEIILNDECKRKTEEFPNLRRESQIDKARPLPSLFNNRRFTLSSRITAIYQSAQKTVSPLHSHIQTEGPNQTHFNGCNSGAYKGSWRTFIGKL